LIISQTFQGSFTREISTTKNLTSLGNHVNFIITTTTPYYFRAYPHQLHTLYLNLTTTTQNLTLYPTNQYTLELLPIIIDMQFFKLLLEVLTILPFGGITASLVDSVITSDTNTAVTGGNPVDCISFYTYVKKDFANNLSTWKLQAWDEDNNAVCSNEMTQAANWGPTDYTFPCMDGYTIRVAWNQSSDNSIEFDVLYPDNSGWSFFTQAYPIAEWYCCGSK
jgi:hypothetical protein